MKKKAKPDRSIDAKKFWSMNEKIFTKQCFYFSQKFGPSIHQKTIKIWPSSRKKTLDFGCGPGFFLDFLASKNVEAEGAEIALTLNGAACFSPIFKKKIYDSSLIPISKLQSGEYGRIYLMEILEHLNDKTLVSVLEECRRLADPINGQIIVTTPNEERLEDSTLTCPFCSNAFHRWQHVRRFDQKSLSLLMERHGWRTVCCEALNWEKPARTLRYYLRKILCLEEKKDTKPHLFYAGCVRIP